MECKPVDRSQDFHFKTIVYQRLNMRVKPGTAKDIYLH